VDLQNIETGVLVGVWEHDLTIDTTWPHQGVVENVDTVSCHNDLDLLGRLEAVK